MEEILLALNVDPDAIDGNLKTKVDNTNKIEKIEKRINIIDKKVKGIEAVKSENKEKHKIKCKICAKEFPDNAVLKEHIHIQHPVVIKCRFCAETFQETWMLEMHIKSHAEKSFKCNVCSQSGDSTSTKKCTQITT